MILFSNRMNLFVYVLHFIHILAIIANINHGSQFIGQSSLSQLESKFDEQLYSRQIFVYGKSAQQQLLNGHVLLYGNGQVAAEILKNLALAGVGKISLIDNDVNRVGPESRLIGEANDLLSYALSLNPSLNIDREVSLETLGQHNIIVAVFADTSIPEMKQFNNITRHHGIKFIGAGVRGVCGFVFNDFLDRHHVLDVDGESRKEVPILSIAVMAQKDGSKSIKVTCIDEDRFVDVGLGDVVDITFTKDSNKVEALSATVSSVINPRNLVIDFHTSDDVDRIVNQFIEKQLHGTLKKLPQTCTLSHQSFIDMLKDPKSFLTPSNGCMAPKKDKAMSLALLSAFLALDNRNPSSFKPVHHRKKKYLNSNSDDGEDDDEQNESLVSIFRSQMIGELSNMCVEKPLKPIKLGGVVGAEAIDKVSSRFFHSTRTFCVGENDDDSQREMGVCAATVSVIGSIAAQEAIKAITNTHMPINQLLMFESLDSLHMDDDYCNDDNNYNNNHGNEEDQVAVDENDDNEDNKSKKSHFDKLFGNDPQLRNAAKVYGIAVAHELRQLKLFIVGAGAIGSELLKTLALMGVSSSGSGSSRDSSNGSDSDSDSGSSLLPKKTIKSINKSKLNWHALTTNGGIVLTDMDSIERSNLNRQLLYRERHIGSSKSLVASEMIKHINSRMNIVPLTNKVSPDTEIIFNSEFWSHIDIVLPALDNVDARLYVDSLCVSHRKWLLDSGTLGTKGSTQVVIPGVTESYSSSADPPEDSIPMCTLKSFPYQPEHCISWARGLFDRLYSEEIQSLKSCLDASLQSKDNMMQLEKKLEKLCETMSPEAIDNMYKSLNLLLLRSDSSVEGAMKWSVDVFNEIYEKELVKLLQEHPLDSRDDQDVPFWGGSRRVPKSIHFDPRDEVHRQFVLWAALLKLKVSGVTGGAIRSVDDPALVSAYHSVTGLTAAVAPVLPSSVPQIVSPSKVAVTPATIIKRTPIWKQSQTEIDQSTSLHASVSTAATTATAAAVGVAAASIASDVSSPAATQTAAIEEVRDITVPMLIKVLNSIPTSLQQVLHSSLAPEDFEKDDSTLGHVDFVTAASNLRCLAYSIRTTDRLEVQRIAGKIVPALVTTTSLVSGLVCLELLKVASERIRERRRHLLQQATSTTGMSGIDTTDRGSGNDSDQVQQTAEESSQSQSQLPVDAEFTIPDMLMKLVKSFAKYISTRIKNSRRNSRKSKYSSKSRRSSSRYSKPEQAKGEEEDDVAKSVAVENDRKLQRFRNSFVNAARSLLAFSQPVAAESYGHAAGHVFTMWDVIEVDQPVDELTVEDLEEVLMERYQVNLQSVTFGDYLLFAKFLPDGEFLSSLSIAELIAHAKQNSKMDDDDDNDNDNHGNDSFEEESNDENAKDNQDSTAANAADDEDDDDDDMLSDPLAEVFGDEEHGTREYIDLIIACQNEDEQDIRLPSVRVRTSTLSASIHDESDYEGMKSSKSHRSRKRKSANSNSNRSNSIIDKVIDFVRNIFQELPFKF